MTRACAAAWLVALGLATPGGALPQERPAGALEFVARVTPTAGRPQPALGFTFYLLTKSFADINKEADEAEPKPDLDKFIEGLDVSAELKAWMKRHHAVQLGGADFLRRLTVADVMDIPEFYQAYLARNAGDISMGFPAPKFRERDRARNPQRYEKQLREYREAIRKFLEANLHTREGMDLHLIALDPSQRWALQEADRKKRVRLRGLELAGTKYLVAHVESDLEGRGGVRGLAPGEYWLSTLENEAVAGDVRLRWDLAVRVSAGQTARVELSNVNAVKPGR